MKTMQEEIESMRKVVTIDYSPITINRYVNVLNKLKTAVPRFYGKEYITFLELTPDFIKAFDTFLKTEAGLAFSDIPTLTREHLVQDNNGDWWIRKGRVKLEHRRKASSVSNVPLLPVPIAILKKYENHPLCVKTGRCLPVMCNQRMNSYLKEIADLCGINKNLTTHAARHNKNYIYLNMR